MKLPIHLDIEKNTVWTEYKAQLDCVLMVSELRDLISQWKDIYSIEIGEVTQDTVDQIKAEKVNDVIAELLIPLKILLAMVAAEKYKVTINCAFIQANGGLGEFEQ